MAQGLVIGNKNDTTTILTGDANVEDVLVGKKFYKDDPNTKLTGTLTAVKIGDPYHSIPIDISLSITVDEEDLTLYQTLDVPSVTLSLVDMDDLSLYQALEISPVTLSSVNGVVV